MSANAATLFIATLAMDYSWPWMLFGLVALGWFGFDLYKALMARPELSESRFEVVATNEDVPTAEVSARRDQDDTDDQGPPFQRAGGGGPIHLP
jgi:hypothetical protein